MPVTNCLHEHSGIKMGVALQIVSRVRKAKAERKRNAQKNGRSLSEELLDKKADHYFYGSGNERTYLLKIVRSTVNKAGVK